MNYKHRDIVIAYMDGKQIQVKGEDGVWRNLFLFDGDHILPQFRSDREYRIKPETRKYRVAASMYNRAHVVNNEAEEKRLKECGAFKHWLTDWVEYKID